MDFIATLFSDQIIYALGWTVVHSLWQGLLLAVLLVLAMMALEKKSARLRYEVACGALFMMLLSGLATFILYLDAGEQTNELIISMTGGVGASTLTLQAYEVGFFQSLLQSAADFFNQNILLITGCWFLGFLFFSIKMAGGIWYLHRLRTTEVMEVEEIWQDKLNRLIQKTPMDKPVRLMESALIKVPVLLGHLKPMILLPIGTVTMLTEEEVEAILAHELAHILRNDFLMNLFFSFIEILFYYHPGVWLIAATVRSERENCCDDLALRLSRNPLAYARALFRLEEAHRAATIPGFALTFSSKKNQLLTRIKRILNQPQNKYNVMEKLTATSFLLLVIAFLSIGAATPFDHTEKEMVISASIEKLDNPVIVVEAKPTAVTIPAINFPIIHVIDNHPDTIPAKKERKKLIKTENGKTVEVMLEDDIVQGLKIDGEVIPPSAYGDHRDMLDEFIVEMDNVPAPPTPPTPPAPPAPLSFDMEEGNAKVHISGDDFLIHIDEKKEEVIMKFIDDLGEQKEMIISENGIQIDGDIIIDDDGVVIDADAYETITEKGIQYDGDDFDIDGSMIVEEEDGTTISKMTDMQEREQERHQRALERHQAAMERHEVEMQRTKERLEREMERHEAEMQRARERMEHEHERLEREREKMDTKMQLLQEKMEAKRAQMERELERKNDELNERLEAEMLKDGLIDNPDRYKFVLTGKELKINKKKQPKAIFEKYLDIYEEWAGYSLSKNSKVTIQRN